MILTELKMFVFGLALGVLVSCAMPPLSDILGGKSIDCDATVTQVPEKTDPPIKLKVRFERCTEVTP